MLLPDLYPNLFSNFYLLKLKTHRVVLEEFSQTEHSHAKSTQTKEEGTSSNTPKALLMPPSRHKGSSCPRPGMGERRPQTHT